MSYTPRKLLRVSLADGSSMPCITSRHGKKYRHAMGYLWTPSDPHCIDVMSLCGGIEGHCLWGVDDAQHYVNTAVLTCDFSRPGRLPPCPKCLNEYNAIGPQT